MTAIAVETKSVKISKKATAQIAAEVAACKPDSNYAILDKFEGGPWRVFASYPTVDEAAGFATCFANHLPKSGRVIVAKISDYL